MAALRYFVVFLSLVGTVLCNSAGAPVDACVDLTPQHGVDPQKSDSPYSFTLSKPQIRNGDRLQITVTGKTPKDTIKGFLVQARVGNQPIGHFEIASNNPYAQTLDCGNAKGNAVTHQKIEGDGPNSVTFTWVAPKGLTEEVQIVGTVALNGGVFWVAKNSKSVKVI